MLFNISLPGWLLIFLLLTPLTYQTQKPTSRNTQLFSWHLQLCSKTWLSLDEHLSFSDQSTSLSKVCYFRIRQLRCIRSYLDPSTACTIATSIVHSKLDYSNFHYYKLRKSQLSRLQQIQYFLLVPPLKLLPYHSHPTLSSLAQNQRTRRIQAPLTYLQSSHNYPTTTPL